MMRLPSLSKIAGLGWRRQLSQSINKLGTNSLVLATSTSRIVVFLEEYAKSNDCRIIAGSGFEGILSTHLSSKLRSPARLSAEWKFHAAVPTPIFVFQDQLVGNGPSYFEWQQGASVSLMSYIDFLVFQRHQPHILRIGEDKNGGLHTEQIRASDLHNLDPQGFYQHVYGAMFDDLNAKPPRDWLASTLFEQKQKHIYQRVIRDELRLIECILREQRLTSLHDSDQNMESFLCEVQQQYSQLHS